MPVLAVRICLLEWPNSGKCWLLLLLVSKDLYFTAKG
jgi:hypothetical protein